MRRAPIVLAATILGTTGVLMFKPREATPALASDTSTSKQATVKKSGTSTVATGSPVDTQFGTTQVQVTIKDGKITDVKALQTPSGDPRSAQISSYAEPTLRQSALTKQSAAIDTVSGATFTSKSYAASLQSALDKAKFKAADGSTAPTTAPTEDGGGGRGHGGHGPFG
jgi:uncharacterized protein with FMN-binding domain